MSELDRFLRKKNRGIFRVWSLMMRVDNEKIPPKSE
jgi:hypothetical protein